MHTRIIWLLLAASGCSSASLSDGARLPWSDDDSGRGSSDPSLSLVWEDDEIVPGVGPAYLSRTPSVQGLLLPDRIVATAAGARTPRWSVSLATAGWGREPELAHLEPVAPGDVQVDGAWFESRRAGLTEWAEATADGIEHGYTVHRAPAGPGLLAVALEIEATGGPLEVWPTPRRDGIGVAVGDVPRLAWSGLRVWDADQRPLDAWIEVAGTGVRVLVDDAGAAYPVTIDPLLSTQASVVDLETGVASTGLGWSIGSDGDRLIIGDPGLNADAFNPVVAVAYPWGPSEDAPWEEHDVLPTPSQRQGMGVSVALEANIAAAAVPDGRVVTFARTVTGWVHDETITVDTRCDTMVQPCLQLDIVDERLIVGNGATAAGEVRVYTHYNPASPVWTLAQTLPGAGSDRFGAALGADDSVLAVGAPGAGEVAVYRFDQTTAPTYALVATHTGPTDFGAAVSVSGSWMAVGAPGSAAVFLYQTPTLAVPVQEIRVDAPPWASERFGASVALHQTTLVVTDLPVDPQVPPRLYVYEHSDFAEWTLREAFDLTPGAAAPLPVTLSDGMIAVGERTTGAFRTWRRKGSDFEIVNVLQGTAGSGFGAALDVDDDLVVIGTPLADGFLPGQIDMGTVHARLREGDNSFTVAPTATLSGTNIGRSVGTDGGLVVAGGVDMANVYVGAGVLPIPLVPADAGIASGLGFGEAVAMDSYGVVVGIPGLDQSRGGAAVFAAGAGDTWVHVANIRALTDGAAPGDNFGKVVAMSGGDIYVGSQAAAAGGILRGELRLYRLDDTLTPYLVQSWTGSVNGERFAVSIDVEGDRVAVGRRGAGGGAGGVSILRGYSATPEWEWVSTTGGAAYGVDVALAGDVLYVASCSFDQVRRFNRAFNRSYYTEGELMTGGCVIDAAADMAARTATGADEVEIWQRSGSGPPVARPDFAQTVEGGPPILLDVLDNDLDPNGEPITLVSVETTDGGVPPYVTLSGDRLQFTPPDPDFDLSQFVLYTIEADGEQVTGLAEFEVQPANDCPTPNDDRFDEVGFPLTVSFDDTLRIDIDDLLANDGDVDTGDRLTLTRFTQPAPQGSVSREGDALLFDPAGAIGEVTFDYFVEDQGGCERQATVTVEVSNDRPEKVDDPTWELLEDQQLVVGPPGLLSTSFVTDREGDPLTATLVAPPERGSLILADNGAFVYTPEPEDFGTFSFAYQVRDPYNTPLDFIVTLHYQQVNDAPIAVDDVGFTTPEDRQLLIDRDRILVNDRDIDSVALEIRLDANVPPSSGTAVIDSDGNLLYTPEPDYTGHVKVEYMASDLQTTSAPAVVHIDVQPQNDAPIARSWDYGQIEGPVSDSLLTPSNGDPPLVTDPDVDDRPVILLVNGPGNGQVTLNGDGSFVYTPAPGYTGPDQFWYAAVDDELSSAPAKVGFVIFQDPLPGGGTTTTEVPDCIEPVQWFLDADGDGFGTEEFTRRGCNEPERYVAVGGDCDDTRPNRHPGAPEIPDDGIDQNCDGADNGADPVGACSTAGRPASVGALALAALLGLSRRRSRVPPAPYAFGSATASGVALAWLLVVAAPARAEAPGACPSDAVAEVDRAMTSLWETFARLDETGFDRSGKALNAALACLDQVPPPAQVARIHQAMALASFTNGQTRACRRSLAAVRITDPAWKPPETIFPPEHAFPVMFLAATDPGPVAPIGKIAPQEWLVDGVVRDDAPTERAFLLQVREDDQIVWSGYLWYFEEVPDRGQSRKRTPLESPHDWWLGASVHGGLLSSSQAPTQNNSVWQAQEGGTFAGGTDFTLRYTPITAIGGELTTSIVGPSDPVAGGGGLPSGQAVLLLGGAGWTGEVQPFAAARLGAAVDRLRSWRNAPGGALDVSIDTVPSAVVGIVGGVRTDRHRGELIADGYLASFKDPYQLRLRAQGGALVAGPLAVEGMVETRLSTMAYRDVNRRVNGTRENFDLRIGGVLSLWL
jgi:hypothetical protein